MKNILILLVFVGAINSYALSFSDLFTKYMKYDTSFGVGQVNIVEKNDFNSDLTFTYLDFGGGLSLIVNRKYLFSAKISLKKYINLEYTQQNQSGTTEVSSTYADLYFSGSMLWNGNLITLGYDNLNYFVGAREDVIEPVRIDRVTLAHAWRKFMIKDLTPSLKLGVFIPVVEDVSGFDANLAASYKITKKISSTVYVYKSFLEANGNDSESTAYGLNANYRF